MVKINLRKYYPDFYTTDCIIEVPDEVAALMDSYEHAEAAYYLRRYRHKAYYSLDRGDGIERDILFVSLSPCEIYERKVMVEQLHAAIAALPDKQAKRVYAHYFLGMSKRLGLCQKSLFAVPNHLTEQWASEFLRLYPSANILVTTKKDLKNATARSSAPGSPPAITTRSSWGTASLRKSPSLWNGRNG